MISRTCKNAQKVCFCICSSVVLTVHMSPRPDLPQSRPRLWGPGTSSCRSWSPSPRPSTPCRSSPGRRCSCGPDNWRPCQTMMVQWSTSTSSLAGLDHNTPSYASSCSGTSSWCSWCFWPVWRLFLVHLPSILKCLMKHSLIEAESAECRRGYQQ